MTVKPACKHITIYYDEQMVECDGYGWCVEFSDSETTNRFGTLEGAIAYARLSKEWLENSTKDLSSVN